MRKMTFFTVLCSAVLAGCAEKEDTASDPEHQLRVERGQALFMEHCDSCHPRGGRGDYLKRIPATLLVRRSEAELVDWIQGSDKHREMPNFTNLSAQEKNDLAAYLLAQIPSR